MTVKKYVSLLICTILGTLKAAPAFSQFPSDTINLTESRVVPYTLPDPLQMTDGKTVKNAKQWTDIQRPYIYHLYRREEPELLRHPPLPAGKADVLLPVV